MSNFDWNQMRGFIAAAETGSLSAAARQLGLTQPTLSRQVAALEETLGLTLFERIGKKLVLTETGLDLLHHGKSMAQAADALALVATGRSETVEGLVSISAGDGISIKILPPIIAKIRQAAPQVSIDLIVSNALSDLRRREADIAVRHVQPTEPDLIGKKLRDAKAHFYASKSWVEEHGHPHKPEDVSGPVFIGFDRSERFVGYLQGLGLKVTAASFPVSSENTVACWEMTRQGLGIGVMMLETADNTEGMVKVLEDLPPITFPIWLVTHRELRTSRRIRLVFDMLAEELSNPA
ncbi:MAG: LysR family transcriptional regulator [Pseudomonadota bacterium]